MVIEHRYDPKRSGYPAALIACICGWQHWSVFTFLNERALRRHLEMHRWSTT